MVLARNILLCGLAVFCFATLPNAEAQDAVINFGGGEALSGFLVQRGGPPRGIRSPSDRQGPPSRGHEGHGHHDRDHGHHEHGHHVPGHHVPNHHGPSHHGPSHHGPSHHAPCHHGHHGPKPCTACPPAKPCKDATICVRPTSRPCYTPEGVNAFVALFRDAAEKGVENAAIRAFNSTRVAPAAGAQPAGHPHHGPAVKHHPAPSHRPAAKCSHCQKSECKGSCKVTDKKPECDGKSCKKSDCKECSKKSSDKKR